MAFRSPAISQRTSRYVALAPEATYGTAPGATATDRQVLRRTGVTMNLEKDAFRSNEVRTDFQRVDVRHGPQTVPITLDGELSNDSYTDLFAAVLRGNFVNSAGTDYSATDTKFIFDQDLENTTGTVTLPSGTFSGLKIGDVLRFTPGSTADVGAANGSGNGYVNIPVISVASDGSSFTTIVNQVDQRIVDEDSDTPGSGRSYDVAIAGARCFTPSSNHIAPSFTIEDHVADVDASRLISGARFGGFSLNVPPDNIATVSFTGIAQDVQLLSSGSAPYYTFADLSASQGSTRTLAGPNGALSVYGQTAAIVTGFSLDVTTNLSTRPVIGSPLTPDVFYGDSIDVTGQVTTLIQDYTLFNAFRQELLGDLFLLLELPGASTAFKKYMSFYLPRITATSFDEDDATGARVVTFDFEAFKQVDSGEYKELTTIVMHDSEVAISS